MLLLHSLASYRWCREETKHSEGKSALRVRGSKRVTFCLRAPRLPRELNAAVNRSLCQTFWFPFKLALRNALWEKIHLLSESGAKSSHSQNSLKPQSQLCRLRHKSDVDLFSLLFRPPAVRGGQHYPLCHHFRGCSQYVIKSCRFCLERIKRKHIGMLEETWKGESPSASLQVATFPPSAARSL